MCSKHIPVIHIMKGCSIRNNGKEDSPPPKSGHEVLCWELNDTVRGLQCCESFWSNGQRPVVFMPSRVILFCRWQCSFPHCSYTRSNRFIKKNRVGTPQQVVQSRRSGTPQFWVAVPAYHQKTLVLPANVQILRSKQRAYQMWKCFKINWRRRKEVGWNPYFWIAWT